MKDEESVTADIAKLKSDIAKLQAKLEKMEKLKTAIVSANTAKAVFYAKWKPALQGLRSQKRASETRSRKRHKPNEDGEDLDLPPIIQLDED